MQTELLEMKDITCEMKNELLKLRGDCRKKDQRLEDFKKKEEKL